MFVEQSDSVAPVAKVAEPAKVLEHEVLKALTAAPALPGFFEFRMLGLEHAIMICNCVPGRHQLMPFQAAQPVPVDLTTTPIFDHRGRLIGEKLINPPTLRDLEEQQERLDAVKETVRRLVVAERQAYERMLNLDATAEDTEEDDD